MQDLTINRHAKIAGFSLLEIMVAVSILSIVFVSVFKMHSQTLSMTIAAKFDIIAPFLAKQKLSELETNNLLQATSDAGDFGDRYAGYQWRIDTEAVRSEILGETPHLRKIDIVVSMNNDKNVFRLRSYRFIFD